MDTCIKNRVADNQPVLHDLKIVTTTPLEAAPFITKRSAFADTHNKAYDNSVVQRRRDKIYQKMIGEAQFVS